MKQKAKTSPGRTAVFLLLLLGAFTMVVPFVWMLSTSLKEAKLVYEIPPRWIPDPVDWHNYVEVWTSLWLSRCNQEKKGKAQSRRNRRLYQEIFVE